MSSVAYAQTVEQGFEMQRQDPRNQQFPGQQGNQQQLQMQQMAGGQGAFGGYQQPGTGQQGGTGSIFGDAPGAGTPGTSPIPDTLRLDQPKVPLSPTAIPVDEPIDPTRYVLGPNDVLEALHFWGVENFRIGVTVDLEGRGFVPKVGYLVLQGKTLAEGRRCSARRWPGTSPSSALA